MNSLFSSQSERFKIVVTPYSWSWGSAEEINEINSLIALAFAILSRFFGLFFAMSLISMATCFCSLIEQDWRSETSCRKLARSIAVKKNQLLGLCLLLLCLVDKEDLLLGLCLCFWVCDFWILILCF